MNNFINNHQIVFLSKMLQKKLTEGERDVENPPISSFI